jgi:hypothetical protein
MPAAAFVLFGARVLYSFFPFRSSFFGLPCQN